MDRHAPGWFLRLNLGTLNIQYANACVIGQVDKDYNTSELTPQPRPKRCSCISRRRLRVRRKANSR